MKTWHYIALVLVVAYLAYWIHLRSKAKTTRAAGIAAAPNFPVGARVALRAVFKTFTASYPAGSTGKVTEAWVAPAGAQIRVQLDNGKEIIASPQDLRAS